MKFINKTPHGVVLKSSSGVQHILLPEKPAARVAMEQGAAVDEVEGIAILPPPALLGITGLPEPKEGCIVIVSQITALLVAALHPDRYDVVYPASSQSAGAIKDELGILYVTQLIMANRKKDEK